MFHLFIYFTSFYWINCTLTHLFFPVFLHEISYFPSLFPFSVCGSCIHESSSVKKKKKDVCVCVCLPLGCVLKFEGGRWQWLTVTGNASHPTGANQHRAQLNPVTLHFSKRCFTAALSRLGPQLWSVWMCVCVCVCIFIVTLRRIAAENCVVCNMLMLITWEDDSVGVYVWLPWFQLSSAAMHCSNSPPSWERERERERERAGVEEAVLREEGTWKRGGRFREQ